MLKFMKKKLKPVIWSLLAVFMLSAPSVSFGMDRGNYGSPDILTSIKNYFTDRLPGTEQFPVEKSNEVSGTFNRVKNNFINEVGDSIVKNSIKLIGLSPDYSEEEETPSLISPSYLFGSEDNFSNTNKAEEIRVTDKHQTLLSKQIKPVITDARDAINGVTDHLLYGDQNDKTKPGLMNEVKKLQANILTVNENINSKWSTILENKYRIAGGTALAIVATIVLVKATRLAFDKFITGSKIIGPQFLVSAKKPSWISQKIQALLGTKENSSLFLNQDIANEVANYVLLHKTVSNYGLSDLNYKNLVLTGSDNFIKTKIAESVAKQSSAALAKIDAHSMLFDQNISDDQKRILVKSFFDKISKSKTLVFVNLDHATLNQLENNGFNKIVADIVNHAKKRSSKISFIFACPDMNSEYSKLLDGCYDQAINVQSPDKNGREQIIKNLVNKLILNREKAILEKARIKSSDISDRTKEDFRSYLTTEKLSYIADKLEGQSYQSVENFVKQLAIMISDKKAIPIRNYDLAVNILLGKSNIKNGMNS